MLHAQIDFKQYKLVYDVAQINAVDKKVTKALRRHFIDGAGKDFVFSKGVVQELSQIISKRSLLKKKKVEFLEKVGDRYWYSVPTYPTKYSIIVGRVNIAFEKNEADQTIRVVALEDIYDFNPKAYGIRPGVFEMITRIMHTVVYRKKGTAFKMYYLDKEM